MKEGSDSLAWCYLIYNVYVNKRPVDVPATFAIQPSNHYPIDYCHTPRIQDSMVL